MPTVESAFTVVAPTEYGCVAVSPSNDGPLLDLGWSTIKDGKKKPLYAMAATMATVDDVDIGSDYDSMPPAVSNSSSGIPHDVALLEDVESDDEDSVLFMNALLNARVAAVTEFRAACDALQPGEG